MERPLKRLSSKLTYANVISTLCLFLLLGGGAAFAADKLAKNAVGAKQVKKNAITTTKIKNAAITGGKLANGAVTGAKIADGAVTGAKIANGTISGAKIDQASLTSVRASNVISFAISGDDNCTPSLPMPAGATSERTSTGFCVLRFASSLAGCTETATVHLRDLAGNIFVPAGTRVAWTRNAGSAPNVLSIITPYNGEESDLPVDVQVVC
jgi:hypothetical protein